MSVIHFDLDELANLALAVHGNHGDLDIVCDVVAKLGNANAAAYADSYGDDPGAITGGEVRKAITRTGAPDVTAAARVVSMLSYNCTSQRGRDFLDAPGLRALLCEILVAVLRRVAC